MAGPEVQKAPKKAKETPTTVLKQRKIVKFIRGATDCKYGVAANGDFSEDDDEDAMAYKRGKMALLEESKTILATDKNRWKSNSTDVLVAPTSDLPFESWSDNFYHQLTLFGAVEDILPEWHPEVARRTMILLDNFLAEFNEEISITLDPNREEEFSLIPERGCFLPDLEALG